MSNTYGVGLVGCGVISPVHLEALKRVPNARLIATCDVIEERAKAAAEKYGAAAWYQDYRELLARPDIDFVHITTPSSLHHEVSIAASSAGKHSFVTKPVDVTLAHIDAMIAAADAGRVKLAAVHQFRAYASYGALKDAVDRGHLGQIHYGNALVPWWRAQDYYTGRWQGTWQWDGGGALMNQSVHWVDLLLWVMGDAEIVGGFAATRAHQMETEDIGMAAIRFRSGAHGLLQGTTLTYKGMATRFEVHGAKGNVVIEADRVTHWNVDGVPNPVQISGDGKTCATDPRAGLGDAIGAHHVQIEAFIRWIEGRGEPLVTGRDARRAVELNLAVYESQRTGQMVRLPLGATPSRF